MKLTNTAGVVCLLVLVLCYSDICSIASYFGFLHTMKIKKVIMDILESTMKLIIPLEQLR